MEFECCLDGCDTNPKICDYQDEIEVYSNLIEAALKEFDSNFTSYQTKYFYARDSIYKFVANTFVLQYILPKLWLLVHKQFR